MTDFCGGLRGGRDTRLAAQTKALVGLLVIEDFCDLVLVKALVLCPCWQRMTLPETEWRKDKLWDIGLELAGLFEIVVTTLKKPAFDYSCAQ